MSLCDNVLMFDVEQDDGLLPELLEGRITTVEREDDTVILFFADGRKVILVISAFGLIDGVQGEC